MGWAWSQITRPGTIYDGPCPASTRHPEGDSVRHEDRGCASSSAVSPGPSPATQLDLAQLGLAFPECSP